MQDVKTELNKSILVIKNEPTRKEPPSIRGTLEKTIDCFILTKINKKKFKDKKVLA